MTTPESPPIPGAKPFFPEEDLPGILDQIGEVLRGGRLILGPKSRELEAAWAERTGVEHAVAVSSCTAALEIAYRYYQVAGGEVVVPTNTFVATANAAISAGARVVFADMDEGDYGVDVDDALAKITPATKVVVAVHIAGFIPREMDRLARECRARKIPVLEDCAHAHGSTLRGREAGSLGDAGCFSLYPTKVTTSCTGGMLTTNDPDLAAFARSLRHHGQGPSLEEIVLPGNDWVLDEVRSVLAAAQLERLDDFLAHRRAVAARYDALLANDGRFTLPKLHPELSPAWYKYPVLLPEGADRDGIRKRIHEQHHIEMGALYSPPCHLMPVFRKASSPGDGAAGRAGAPHPTGPGQLPKAERALARQICLPMHARVSMEDADRSVAVLREALG